MWTFDVQTEDKGKWYDSKRKYHNIKDACLGASECLEANAKYSEFVAVRIRKL